VHRLLPFTHVTSRRFCKFWINGIFDTWTFHFGLFSKEQAQLRNLMLYPTSSQCCQPCELLQTSINRYEQFGQIDVQQRWLNIGTDCCRFSLSINKTLTNIRFLKIGRRHWSNIRNIMWKALIIMGQIKHWNLSFHFAVPRRIFPPKEQEISKHLYYLRMTNEMGHFSHFESRTNKFM
jgi:hypothetical protein